MNVGAVLAIIEKAFATYPAEVDSDIGGSQQEIYDLFAKKRWHELEKEELYFTDELAVRLPVRAFSYYVAAYLKLFLSDYYKASTLVSFIISMLTPPLTNGLPRSTWIDKKLLYFTEAQKNAIALTFKFLECEYQDTDAEYALEVYWGKYLADAAI